MNSLICSDLHGYGLGATRLQALVDRYHPDRILLLGDLFYSGGRWSVPDTYDPSKTFTVISHLADRILAVRGNCDRDIDVAKSGLAMSEVRHLRQGEHIIFMIHDQRMLEEPLSEGDILLCGHTHIPSLVKYNGVLYANPGSLSWPRGGTSPCFIWMDETQITLLDLDGKVLVSEKL